MWPEMENKLFDAFMKQRKEIGTPVRDGWFWRDATELWKQSYPELQEIGLGSGSGLFVFSQGWFNEFLSCYRIVLRFVTNTAQSLPNDCKNQILIWLRFNRRNPILTPLFSSQLSPHSVHLLCNDNHGGIPEHRICNVNETPLPWESLLGRTHDSQGAKTVCSKSADLASEKWQSTLFLRVFADGIPWVHPIFIFTASTSDKIQQKKSSSCDKQVHVEFSPTGWMNDTFFSKFVKKFLIPIFGDHRAFLIDTKLISGSPQPNCVAITILYLH